MTIAILSVSPQIAGPGQRVTVTGTVSNPTGSPVPGLAVKLWSSTARFTTRARWPATRPGNCRWTPGDRGSDPLAGALRPGTTGSGR